jgi:hypothetical protein
LFISFKIGIKRRPLELYGSKFAPERQFHFIHSPIVSFKTNKYTIEFLTVYARALIHRSAQRLIIFTQSGRRFAWNSTYMCMRVYSNLITEYGCMADEKVSAAREQAERIDTIIVIKRALHSTTLLHGKVHLWNNNCVHSACSRRRWKSPTVVTK